jgi:hypothetical protein
MTGLHTDEEIFRAGIEAVRRLPPASPEAVQRTARILSAALKFDQGNRQPTTF